MISFSNPCQTFSLNYILCNLLVADGNENTKNPALEMGMSRSQNSILGKARRNASDKLEARTEKRTRELQKEASDNSASQRRKHGKEKDESVSMALSPRKQCIFGIPIETQTDQNKANPLSPPPSFGAKSTDISPLNVWYITGGSPDFSPKSASGSAHPNSSFDRSTAESMGPQILSQKLDNLAESRRQGKEKEEQVQPDNKIGTRVSKEAEEMKTDDISDVVTASSPSAPPTAFSGLSDPSWLLWLANPTIEGAIKRGSNNHNRGARDTYKVQDQNISSSCNRKRKRDDSGPGLADRVLLSPLFLLLLQVFSSDIFTLYFYSFTASESAKEGSRRTIAIRIPASHNLARYLQGS